MPVVGSHEGVRRVCVCFMYMKEHHSLGWRILGWDKGGKRA